MMKRRTHILFLCFLAILLPATSSIAGGMERVVLHFGDSRIKSDRNYPAPVFLKKELRQQHPYLDLPDLDLRRVIVVAKSRKGYGTVQLRVGRDLSQRDTIGGSPWEFGNPARQTFDRIKLRNPAGRSNGPWQLLLQGNIILRKVILVMDNARTYSPPAPRYWHEDYEETHRDYNRVPANSYQEPFHQKRLTLSIKSWGTDIEGEKRCGRKSNNARDGWNYPHRVCTSGSPSYAAGYTPTRLYVRPDSGQLQKYSGRGRVRELTAKLVISPDKPGKGSGPVAATLGIEIQGRTYTQDIRINRKAVSKGKSSSQKLRVNGNWQKYDLAQAKIWVLPHSSSSSFKVDGLEIVVSS